MSTCLPSPGPALLELQGITLAGRGQLRLETIKLRIQSGERVALIGASGAGKSSLLAVANGLIKPDAGTLLWQGVPPAKSRRQRSRQQARIGTLWQDLRLIEELTVPFAILDQLIERSGYEGRSISNLAAFLLEQGLTTRR
eukprot:gene2009-biopygen1780